jgi:hypothetical protein
MSQSFFNYQCEEFLNNVFFVVATKNTHQNLLENRPFGFFIEKMGLKRDKDYYCIESNTEGLPKVYNSFINEKFQDKCAIFIHDDVTIVDLYYQEKIMIAFEKYDIIGLAGTKKCDLSAKNLAWHTMTDRESMVGEVMHKKDDQIWTTCFGPTNSRALIIDGLFIGVKIRSLLEKEVKFDENFDFHHYDISFSLRANEKKLKTGVFPLSVIHTGLGDSMNTKEWVFSSNKFRNLYSK